MFNITIFLLATTITLYYSQPIQKHSCWGKVQIRCMTSKGYVHLLYIQCSQLKRHIYRVYWSNCIYSQFIMLWNEKINAVPVHKHNIIHAGLHFQRLHQISVYETQWLHMRCFNCYTGINWTAMLQFGLVSKLFSSAAPSQKVQKTHHSLSSQHQMTVLLVTCWATVVITAQ